MKEIGFRVSLLLDKIYKKSSHQTPLTFWIGKQANLPYRSAHFSMPILQRFSNDNAPDGIEIERSTHGLCITRSWDTGAGYAMLGWVAVWFGIVAFFTTLGGHRPGWDAWILALPGLGMFYAAMTRFFNRTRIELGPSRLTVRHGPLPWPGGKRFATRDIANVCGECGKVYSKGVTVNVYRVVVVRRDGNKSRLLSGLEMSEPQTNFIVAALNDHLLASSNTKTQ